MKKKIEKGKIMDLKRGDIFKSKINGKKWEVAETTLGKKVKLLSGLKNESYWLHMYIEYVMKSVKMGTKFEDTFILLNDRQVEIKRN